MFQRDRQKLGRWMADSMSELGPAMTKVGQFMSTRADIFSKDITDALATLQDNTNVVAYDQIEKVIEAELGCPAATIFASVDPVPLASASIGQVHRARMRMKRGPPRDVAIKVCKPGVRERIYEDLATLKAIAAVLGAVGAQRARELDPLLSEYERFLTAELDYRAELQHMRAFSTFFADGEGDDGIVIPRTYPTVSSSGLLVMDYVPSTKITDIEALKAMGVDADRRADLATRIFNVFIRQITELGQVHCDPHPGNIGVLADGETIVLYDFGNVIQFSEAFRGNINALMVAIVERDVDEFVRLMAEIGLFTVGDPMDMFELRAFFRVFFAYLENVDFEKLKTSLMVNEALSQSNLQVQIDNNFFALFRVFSLLDGTCTLLNPTFNYIDVIAPFTMNALQDARFLDYRIRRDVSKANGTSSIEMANKTQELVVGLNGRLRQMSERSAFFRQLVVALAFVNVWEEPVSAVALAPLIVALVWYERRGK
jgi:predicted unusual protein kinase regulating ubiquinone biosynthesis (AarF/ABC1/UbiB family)